MGTANVTLYAKWTANIYTITFDRNDASGGGFMASQNIPCGSTVNLNANGFSVSCENFIGWATSPNGSPIYANQASYTMGTSNVTLYAIWAYPAMTVSPAFGQDISAGGSGVCNPTLTVSTSTCAASYEWHVVLFTDNIVTGATGPTVTADNGWEPVNYYCIVTDYLGNKITSGTWHVASCY